MASSSVRLLAGQAFSRAAGAPLVQGNALRLLRDARENYPAWLDAIAGAERWIHFESYIIHGDAVGRQFADALAARARDGVRVRVLYDWVGGLGTRSRPLWRLLRDAGAEVRVFNPPRLDHPLSWLSRDHRKMLAVDGEVGFVSGLCVGQAWAGEPDRGLDPWRDTGVAIRGPAVLEVEEAFAEVWRATGAPLPDDEQPTTPPAPAGDVALRVIATMPTTAGMMRLDQLVAALAKRTLWIADAYFVGTPAYVQGLRAAARDGVDVRVLVPGGSDLVLVPSLTRAGYRPLLEAGVRVFEWQGPMMHAKTAVADRKWSRVGSTNLNVQSWLGNWELDVAIEDDGIGRELADMFEADLEQSTEIVLTARRRVQRADPARARRRVRRGSAGRAAAGALRLGNTLGAALTQHRQLGPTDARVLFMGASLLVVTGLAGALWPAVVVWPLAAACLWVGAGLMADAWRLWRKRTRGDASEDSQPVER